MENMTAQLFIDFGASGNCAEFCQAGWSHPEPGHTWTAGTESTLKFPRPSRPGQYRLGLRLSPFVWKDILPLQRLSISVNGTTVGVFELQGPSTIECPVPWPIIEPYQTVVITLIHPDAAKPRKINGVPDHREIAFALEELRFEPVASSIDNVSSLESAEVPRHAPLPANLLMMQFESLGENCEFGLVQRRCGAEPLGLLRFASAPLPKLMNGLNHRFAGMGELQQLDVEATATEYLVIDRRFGFLYHPWVLIGEAEPEDVRRRETTRLPFLRRKMLDDLREGHKIFVYHGMQALTDEEAIDLLSAIRTYGPGMLLWVELADNDHPPGSVEIVRPGLLKGHIDRFAPGENAHDFSLDCWLNICRNAYSLAGYGR